jgi:hypothetical protein
MKKFGNLLANNSYAVFFTVFLIFSAFVSWGSKDWDFLAIVFSLEVAFIIFLYLLRNKLVHFKGEERYPYSHVVEAIQRYLNWVFTLLWLTLAELSKFSKRLDKEIREAKKD